MKRKVNLIICVILALSLCFSLASCGETADGGNQNNGEADGNPDATPDGGAADEGYVLSINTVYEMAKEAGYTGTLEDLVAMFKGEKGDKGDDGQTPYIGENGNWWIGDRDLGVRAEGEKGDTGAQGPQGDKGDDATEAYENPLGLDFFLKDDGTYVVEIGKAKYLSKIEIPGTYKGKAVTEVAAFSDPSFGNDTLKEIIIPNSIINIRANTFKNCTSLESITIPFVGATKDGTKNTHFGYIFGAPTYENNANYVPSTLKTVVITGGTEIGSSAFYCCDSLASVAIPDSVTEIGADAFLGCYSLTSATIPDSVTTIGSRAFYYCKSLTSVTIPDSVTTIGDYAFYNCTRLTNVTIPDSVTAIGEQAFYNCNSLTNVTIPDSVTAIGEQAFYNCNSLTSVTIPDSVTTIGKQAFYCCTSLTSVTIGNSVTSIGGSAFLGCNKLVEIYNLSSLTITATSDGNGYVAYYALNVYTPTSGEKKTFETNDGFKFYEDGDACYLLGYSGTETDITLPESCNGKSYTIYIFAFCKNNKLTSVIIADSVTEIGSSAFSSCRGLKSITIPDSVTTIGNQAFYECTSLTSLTIPDSVTEIGEEAFCNCTSLTNVTIPDSVTTISDYAFYNCASLANIYYTGSKAKWDAITKGSGWNYETGKYTITYNYVAEEN